MRAFLFAKRPFVLHARLVLACGTLLACTESERGSVIEVDSAGVRIVSTSPPLEEWALGENPVLAIGSMDGGPTEFYRIADLDFLPGDRIAVVNGGTEEIRFFTTKGDHLGSQGRKGHGPGEYDGLYRLEVIGDSIFTHDGGNDRVSVLSLNGQYSRSFRLEWHRGIVTPGAFRSDRTLFGLTSRHMVEMPRAGLVTDSALVSRYGTEGELQDSVGKYAHNQRVVRRVGDLQTVIELPFSERGRMVGSGDGFCYSFGPISEIRCFTSEGRLTQISRLAEEPSRVTAQDIEAYWQRELRSRNRRRIEALRRMRDVMVFPEFYPAFSELVVDDGGRLYAQKYWRAGDREVSWHVSENGRWVRSIRVPRNFELMAVKGREALGVWRDSLGVESVRIYRLQKQ